MVSGVLETTAVGLLRSGRGRPRWLRPLLGTLSVAGLATLQETGTSGTQGKEKVKPGPGKGGPASSKGKGPAQGPIESNAEVLNINMFGPDMYLCIIIEKYLFHPDLISRQST